MTLKFFCKVRIFDITQFYPLLINGQWFSDLQEIQYVLLFHSLYYYVYGIMSFQKSKFQLD